LDTFRFRWTFFGVLIVGIVALDVLILAIGYAIGFRYFRSNEGPLEAVQLVVLAVVILSFIALIYRVRHAARLVASGAAGLCILLFFREFETPVRNPTLDFMSNDRMLYYLSVVLSVFILIQVFLNWSHMPAFLGWLRRIEWWPFLFAGVLLVVGRRFEMAHMAVIEEVLELDGYLVLAIIATAALYRTTRKTPVSEP
jgi:hypothetical protein